MKVAVIGSGIAGLAAAHRLRLHAQVTLFEAGSYFGGHTNTVDVSLPDAQGRIVTHGVDTGFLVFNERTYPGLIALLQELDVPSARTDMSFSVQAPHAGWFGSTLEWNGANLASVFAQKSNLLRPRFWLMLREVLRFNQLCTDRPRLCLGPAAGRFFVPAWLQPNLSRLVFSAHARLHLELPYRPDAAVPSGHHDSLLPQPRPDSGKQPPSVVDRGRRCPPIRPKNHRILR